MIRNLHTAFFLLLGLAVLAGCWREDMQTPSDRIEGGQVQVSLTMALHGFGDDVVVTKADFVDVEQALQYGHEKSIKDYGIFVFDATGAFAVNGVTGLYEFNPSAARQIYAGKVDVLHVEDLGGGLSRCEFKLDDTYKSLAVLVMANFGDAAYSGVPGKGESMQTVVDFFSADAHALAYNTTQSDYLKGGVPKHGWKVFGSWEGLSSSASPADKANCELKYYRGMSTPLTTVGFKNAAELANYAGTTGAVRKKDRLTLRNAMARLHLRYEPKTGQPSATPAAGTASVEITRVRLHNYRKELRALPAAFFSASEYSPYDAVTSVGDLGTGNVEFVHPASGDKSWVAYVPEMAVSGSDNDPYMIVDVRVTDKDGKVVEFVFERDKVVRKEGTNTATYEKSPWTEWLQMKTFYSRKKPDGTDVTIGSTFNLIRNYAYEWIAEGVEGMEL
ncbi:MAG: hypothetical protein IJS66_02520 [Bacteroidales bacterium]|nr:hypothetical protein [Bacteroidales bacterium]